MKRFDSELGTKPEGLFNFDFCLILRHSPPHTVCINSIQTSILNVKRNKNSKINSPALLQRGVLSFFSGRLQGPF